jgi:hypothetical protein
MARGALAAISLWAALGVAASACKENAAESAHAAPAAAPSPAPGAPSAAADAGASCVDAWLLTRSLNQYGDPPGTMYPGGSPLFDEKTGKATDRTEYLYKKHPALASSCPR